MTQTQMMVYARLGAEQRLAELAAEVVAIRSAFPELRDSHKIADAAIDPPPTPRKAGRRPKMTAAARKAVSVRMRAYWKARRRAAKKES